jgi:hypothetical protein
MTRTKSQPALSLPDHKQLPESDGTFTKNFQEHPQSLLLTSSIARVLNPQIYTRFAEFPAIAQSKPCSVSITAGRRDFGSKYTLARIV